MEDGRTERTFDGQPARRRNNMFMYGKEEQVRTKSFLEILAHYDARLLVQTEGPMVVVRRKTGVELPLEQNDQTAT